MKNQFMLKNVVNKIITFTFIILPFYISAESNLTQKTTSKSLTITVSEFQNQGIPENLKWLGKSFADALIVKLSRARVIRVVEREFLNKIIEEMNLQTSDLVDEETAVQVGRLVGAKAIVFGSVSILGKQVVVRARVVSVEKGDIIGVAEANGVKEGIFGIQDKLAKQISSTLAVQAAIYDASSTVGVKVPLNVCADLDRLRQLSKQLPFFGLDPARARKKGEYQQALSICDKLIAGHSNLAQAHYYSALFSLHNEDFKKADRESKIALKLNSNEVDNILLKANVIYASNDFNGAVNAFKEVTSSFPGDARGWYGLGRLYTKQGNKIEATSAYISAIERTPAIAEAETNLQTLLSGEKGFELCKKLKTRKPQFYAPARVFSAFWNNKVKNINDLAIQSINNFPDLYIGYFIQGILERNKKQNKKAISLWQRCLSLQYAFPLVHKELGLLYLKSNRCILGKRHIDIYMRTADFIDDYAALEKQIKRCKK